MLKQLYQIGNKFSPGLQKIIRSIGWLSLEKVFSITLNLTVGVYLIRYLGSDDFGKLSYCLSMVGLFEALAKLGLDAIVVRSLVKEEAATNDILGTALILKLLAFSSYPRCDYRRYLWFKFRFRVANLLVDCDRGFWLGI